jgi:hypothetical protein
VVGAGEKDFRFELFCFGGGELVGPWDAGGGVGAGTGAIEPPVPGLRSAGCLAPGIPALRGYVRTEPGQGKPVMRRAMK